MHQSDIQIEIDYKDNTALLDLREVGKDFLPSLREILTSLEVENLNAIYLDLPLDDPAVLSVMDIIHEEGFIFSGIFPMLKTNRHFLRMQKVFASLDFSLIEIHSDMGQLIKSRIEEEYHANRS